MGGGTSLLFKKAEPELVLLTATKPEVLGWGEWADFLNPEP
jgi:hypothetical protein